MNMGNLIESVTESAMVVQKREKYASLTTAAAAGEHCGRGSSNSGVPSRLYRVVFILV